jgi:hypothetical protein
MLRSTVGSAIEAATSQLQREVDFQHEQTHWYRSGRRRRNDDDVGSCHQRLCGLNSCKGTSECSTAKNACKGQNSCKGMGWVSLSKSECDAAQAKAKAEEKK